MYSFQREARQQVDERGAQGHESSWVEDLCKAVTRLVTLPLPTVTVHRMLHLTSWRRLCHV
jgi:hypothetical protein